MIAVSQKRLCKMVSLYTATKGMSVGIMLTAQFVILKMFGAQMVLVMP